MLVGTPKECCGDEAEYGNSAPHLVPGKIMQYQDLSAHVGTLVSLLGLFAGVSAMLLWRMLVRMEKKLDDLAKHTYSCRQELGERFVARFEHEVEHHGMWEALNYHSHDMRGRVVR
jgi:hypothetical protein